MSVEITFQGAVRVSDIVNNRLVSIQYFGYTPDEAVELFTEEATNG